MILLSRNTVRPFDDKHIELVTTFADQAVIAIENVRLFDEVQARTGELAEALEQQTATAEILQVISSSPGELRAGVQGERRTPSRICEAKFVDIILADDDKCASRRCACSTAARRRSTVPRTAPPRSWGGLC